MTYNEERKQLDNVNFPNMKKSIIQLFTIHGLFGRKDISIDFAYPCAVLIGENGLGKTTILNILNLVLAGEYENLTRFQFNQISIVIKNREFIFSKKDILEYSNRLRNNELEYGYRDFRRLLDLMARTDLNKLSIQSIQNVLSENEDLRISLSNGSSSVERDCLEFIKRLRSFMDLRHIILSDRIKVMYLPTYRRIEADISKVMSDLIIETNRNELPFPSYVRNSRIAEDVRSILEKNRLIKFGMKDIQQSINDFLEVITKNFLKEYSRISGEMISLLLMEDNKQVLDFKFDESEVKIVLERIGNYMAKAEKEKIINLVKTGRINENYYLIYFIKSLLDVYKNLRKRDGALKQFEGVCNEFLYDKRFFYDESHISFKLFYIQDENHSEPISLEKLSSGEKQIISLLATVFLELKDQIILLIDEPELSLSLNWQKKLLPALLKAEACKQIVAVTHSPFVFSNELENTALGSLDYVNYRF